MYVSKQLTVLHSLRQNVRTAKKSHGEVSLRQSVLMAKCPYGEASSRRNVLTQSSEREVISFRLLFLGYLRI